MTDTTDMAGSTRSGPVRAAIVGGGMVAAIHRRAVHAAGGVVVGVLGSRPERSAQIAADWDVATFPDLDALLAAEIDVVHVCTPNSTHASYATAVLRAGRHLVCEKPVATSFSEAEGLAAVAAESGVVATVPYVYRYHPLVRELRARRLAGEFGRWHALHGSYLQDWMLSPDVGNWRVQVETGGRSRAFADIGSHWCDLVEFVSGERFVSLTALTSVAVPERPTGSAQTFTTTAGATPAVTVTTDDLAVVTLTTASGVPANVVVSQVAAGRRNRLWFELDGAVASAVFDQESPETAWIGTPDGATVIARGAGRASGDQRRLSYLPGGHAQGYQDCFNAFVADTYVAIAGDPPDGLPTLADGVRSVGIVDTVLDSAASGAWTAIDGPPE
ncbi:Gfo/Idh/MocA family oxidoreductase [Nonomuraea antimicrobica]|uniref:Gfo/Idh/MocA family oxidoreductase n=1 Tax=Nonomuraea antimicrobica TaxID=561173 RepID=A0ABP7DU77_9ACTN